MGLLKVILPLLPGWPVSANMSHDDRLFAVASVVGTSGFLRGGEFLAAPGSERPILAAGDLRTMKIHAKETLVVRVAQPKNDAGTRYVDVPCFSPVEETMSIFGPLHRYVYREYRRASLYVQSASSLEKSPAFHFANGKPFNRAFMVKRTTELMDLAGVTFVDDLGRKLTVKMTSWRAGGVRSAVDVGLSEPMIKELGRWRSSAWTSYLIHSCLDLQGVSRPGLPGACG